MCGHRSISSFCLFILLLLVPFLSGHANAQQAQSFVALINDVIRERDGYVVDYEIDPATWAEAIDHINVTVYPDLDTDIEIWSSNEIGQDEEIVIPADVFPNSTQLYDKYRIEMELIKDGKIALSDSGQPFLLTQQFVHYPFPESASPPPADASIDDETPVEPDLYGDSYGDSYGDETAAPLTEQSYATETAECNIICQFQERLNNPILRNALFATLGLFFLSLIFWGIQIMRNRPKPQAQPLSAQPRLHKSPIYRQTRIYNIQEHDVEHASQDEMYNNTPPDYDPSNFALYNDEDGDYDEYKEVKEVENTRYTPLPTPSDAHSSQSIKSRGFQPASAHLDVIGARNVTLIGKRHQVNQFPFTIGREDADLIIDDGRISHHHAKLTFDGTTFHIIDLDSRNGVYVEGQKITPNLPMPLSANKEVTISMGSQNHFVFRGYV